MSDDTASTAKSTARSSASSAAGVAPPVGKPNGTAPSAPAAASSIASLPPKLRFDSSNIKSSYCNVCNATSTREEVVINFGLNKTWDTGNRDLEVQLEHRIILSPFAAKRLADMLAKLITEHEQRYGALN